MSRYDLAFIGFGAAAMSLIARLAYAHWPGSLVVIEPSDIQRNDRTWCGWGPNQHPFSDQITQTWSKWAVSQGPTTVTQHAPETPYEMLHAGGVRERSYALIKARSDWDCHLDSAVIDAETQTNGDWQLTLDSGVNVQATWVLDARAPALKLTRPWLWQSFFGVEVEGPAFAHNDSVRLMDFVDAPSAWPSFFYELPISENRRLIEFTQFVPQPSDPATLSAAVYAELARRDIAPSDVIRSESGHLPMAPIAPYRHQHWLRIGAAGGSMRPATGYAFHAIQRWADACSEALLAGHEPIAPRRSRLLDWLDGVFLESLWADPQRGGEQFIALFRDTPPAALSRFLMSRASLSAILRVLLALPKYPMLKAALRHSLRNHSL